MIDPRERVLATLEVYRRVLKWIAWWCFLIAMSPLIGLARLVLRPVNPKVVVPESLYREDRAAIEARIVALESELVATRKLLAPQVEAEHRAFVVYIVVGLLVLTIIASGILQIVFQR